MLTPAYRLTIGDRIVDTTDKPQASTLVDLTVVLDMEAPADSFTLVLGQVGGLAPQLDDDAVIELGFAGDGDAASGSGQGLSRVMTGTVVSVEPGLTTNRVIGHSSADSLLRFTVEQTYEAKTAGEIVSDLADQAGVAVAKAQDGISFPAYVADGQRSVYHHMRDLADLCGFDLYTDAQGELVFEPFQRGKTIHTFEYAKHILEVSARQAPPHAGRVSAWGESPGGGQAEEAWAWLTKDFGGMAGTAGSESPALLLARPALRTADAAQMAADAAYSRIQHRTLLGQLLALGQPGVKLGDAINLRDVPEAALNDTFQVRSVTHRITKQGGFTTSIGFWAGEV
jgi:phage protein D